MALDKSGSEYSISVVHSTDVLECLNCKTIREVLLGPVVKLEITSSFVGPYSMNWLYVSAESKSILHNKAMLVDVPYRPDMLAIERYEEFPDKMYWYAEEAVSGYRSWKSAKRAIVVVSGGTYGGSVDIVDINHDLNYIETSKPYQHNLEFEAVYLVPIIKGLYKSCVIEKDTVEAEIETFKEYVYG